MRITHSTRSASARGKLLRCTRAIRASPSSAVNVRLSTGFCTTHPLRRGPTSVCQEVVWDRHATREALPGVTSAWALGKPSEIRARGADDGVRFALHGQALQATTA